MIKSILLAGLFIGSAAHAETTYVKLYSDAGEYMGQGVTRVILDDTDKGVKISFGLAANKNVRVTTRTRTGTVPEEGWSFEFGAPNEQKLVVGKYENAKQYAWNDPNAPILRVDGNGRACGGDLQSGKFEVLEAVYSDSGWPEKFAAKFEFYCDGRPEALRGSVYLNSSLVATDLDPQVKVDINGKTKTVDAKVGEPITINVNVGANSKTNATIETWVGLLTPTRNQWFNGAGWTELDRPYISKIDYLLDKKQTFTITPKVPGPHLFIYAIDEGINNKMDVKYSGQIVINAK